MPRALPRLCVSYAARSTPLLCLVLLAGCAGRPSLTAEDCMARAMYFESNRSSAEGMLAVGTVVMNRVKSGKYPRSVCGVVGQKKQFAGGVLTKKMGRGRDLAYKTARKVLRGQKHAAVGKAMFFHTAGYSYPYDNMHYVTIAGGNAFYEKRRNASSTQDDVRRREARLEFTPPGRGTAPSVDPARYGRRDAVPIGLSDPMTARAPGLPDSAGDLRSFSSDWTSVATGEALPAPSAAPLSAAEMPQRMPEPPLETYPDEPGVTLYPVAP
ncbi:cell wall hydrolase [Aureimonas sp. Leaf454]|uniref:cell wall hydrolase n=1 Tax=Aureimonas sp. Leaf454 TaxID=1736381 RepID=UPI0009EB0CAF|nr:cell wall hydrolase [Aureimonas sp. Leaf454]